MSTSPAWATCSRSRRTSCGSRRSPTPGAGQSAYGLPDGCRSGTATVSAVPPNSARPSAAPARAVVQHAGRGGRASGRAGLDTNATTNLAALIEDTHSHRAGTHRPHPRGERFRDELGDWRLVAALAVRAAGARTVGALAIGARLRERFGVDAAPTASDDGIIVFSAPTPDDTPPRAELFAFERDEIEDIVTDEVGGSAAVRVPFRECAARALLASTLGRTPGKRAPLWQQRQRSAQLLDVARKFPTFPILLETVRECLQDVYDLPALRDLFGRIARRQIRMVGSRPQRRHRSRVRCSSTTWARSCTRATARSPSVAQPHCRSIPHCSPNCSAGWSYANCSTPTSSRKPSGNCSG
ncbi:hypothetical protein GS449_21190 [Rhodococcus hoagii]|nr:hypothetical protein [Prescottella equi]